MITTAIIIAILIVVLIVWQTARHSQGTSRQADLDRIQKELQDIEEKRQQAINDSAQRGTTISTDQVLKHVEDLKETYVTAGNEEATRDVERVIRDFREQNGPEIPVDKAYALMKELEGKYGK
jgi:Holliday junction resolvase RusA-like endonuclease